MRRIGIITAAILVGLTLILAGLYGFLFYTNAGRGLLLTQIEHQLGAALDSEAEIGTLAGAPPAIIELEDITLKDNDEPWLTIAELDMRWRPFSLLSGAVRIEMFAVNDARLLAAPPGEGSPADNSEPLSIRLPRDLPNVELGRMELSNLTAVISGTEQRLDGAGAISMGGRKLNARFILTSAQDRDIADITLDIAPDAGRIFIDGYIAAQPGGVVAGMAGLDAPLFIEAKSDSPIEDADIRIDANLGDYGALGAAITANLDNLTGADGTLLFTPGAALNGVPELSTPVTADLRVEERRNGGALILRSTGSAAGDITGEVVWRNRGRYVERLTAELGATLSDSYRPNLRTTPLQNYIGSDVTFTAVLERAGGDYAIDAAMESGAARLSLEDGLTDLNRSLAGNLVLFLPPAQSAPAPLSLGAAASGVIDLNLDGSLSARSFTLSIGDASSLTAEGRYVFAGRSLAVTGELEATPALIESLVPSIDMDTAVTGDFTLSGAVDRLTLEAQIDTPSLLMNDARVPALTIRTGLAGLPSLPTGDIVGEAQGDAEERFEAQLRSSVDGAVSIPSLVYRTPDFTLQGNGAYAPAQNSFTLDVSYAGTEEASPWPGLTFSGDLTAQGVLSRNGEQNELSVRAGALRANEIAVAGLEIAAAGPPGATRISLSAPQLNIPGAGVIEDLTADVVADLEDDISIALRAFDAVIADTQATLSEPATISFQNGVSVDNLRLAYGDDGLIALDGSLSEDRWRALAVLTSVNIPQADGQISLTLDLDTDQQTPAQGSFGLRSLLTRGQEAALSGDFVWDGQSVLLSNTEDADALDMRIALPARLIRTPAIAVETTGPLEGYARFTGDIEAVAAYLPPELQSLEGGIDFNFMLAGDTTAPELSGRAEITEGQYTELQSGFALTGLHVEADASYAAQGSVITFNGGARGAGQSGGDTIRLNGALTLAEASSLNLEVTFNDAVLSAQPVTGLRTNGRVVIAGPLNAIRADGDISIEELDAEIITPESTGLVDIEVIGYNAAAQIPTMAETAPAPAIDFNIALVADDRIFVRGRGLESEWSADITAQNENAAPILIGGMELRRGWLDFSGRRFDLTRGVIAFDQLSPNNPTLDIRAEHETGDGVTAVIVVSGRAAEPTIELQSTPSLPSEDIMALVLFGKPAQDLSAVESLQTAEALASLGGVGPFGGQGITGRLRQTLGLDLLNIDIDPENGGGALTIGKYVADGVFVSATQDAEGRNGSVRLEYEVTDNISVETELAQDGEQTVSANWKRDF